MSNKGLPAMGFFVQRMGEIYELDDIEDYYRMFKRLLNTSDCFHEKDQAKCEETRKLLLEYIKKIKSKNGRTHNHTIQLRHQLGDYLYYNGGREAKLKIFKIMWGGGYINKASFRPETRRDTMFDDVE